MMPSKELLREAPSLPVEERGIFADRLLRTLNTPDESIEREWLKTAGRRQEETRSGKVNPDTIMARSRIVVRILPFA